MILCTSLWTSRATMLGSLHRSPPHLPIGFTHITVGIHHMSQSLFIYLILACIQWHYMSTYFLLYLCFNRPKWYVRNQCQSQALRRIYTHSLKVILHLAQFSHHFHRVGLASRLLNNGILCRASAEGLPRVVEIVLTSTLINTLCSCINHKLWFLGKETVG